MPRRHSGSHSPEVRGQKREANSLREVVSQTTKLWRKYHLTYDQTKNVVEQARQALSLKALRERRRTVERLDRAEIERLIETAYDHSSRRGFLVKMLFYTARESANSFRSGSKICIWRSSLRRFTSPTPRVEATATFRFSQLWRRRCARTSMAVEVATFSRAIAQTDTPRDMFRSWSRMLPRRRA
jgi:hypothetical protein